MASFRNFFITFVLALALFGGLAYHYYGDLVALLPGQDVEETSDDTSGDVSGAVSDESDTDIPIFIDPPETEGDDLGILNGLFVCKSEKGEVLSAKFVRINSDTRKVVTCALSLSAAVYNDVSAPVPFRDYLRIYSGEKASQVVCSLVGYRADFYLELTPDSLDELVTWMVNPSYSMVRELKHVNPMYAELEVDDTTVLPVDYYVYVPGGNLSLDAEVIATIREHYTICDGTEDRHDSMEMLLASIYESLLTQLFTKQKDAMLDDPARMAMALSGAETNLDVNFLQEKIELLMKYKGDANYETVEIPYTTRDDTIYKIKLADK